MNKISCDVCLDLVPLVQDNVASEDSRILVMEHLKICPSCNSIFNDIDLKEPEMDNNRVVSKIKKQLYLASIITIVLGAMIGIGLTDSMGVFYNVLIIPTIGAIGYFVLSKKSYYVPLTLFVLVYLVEFIRYTFEGSFYHTTFSSAIIAPGLWALIYAGLCSLGIIIGFLLKIAFRKEGNYEKEN